MALQIPIISEYDGKGVKKAIAEFKQLEGIGKKTSYAVKKAFLPATAVMAGLASGMFKAVKAAADLAEAQSKVNVIFGDGAAEIEAFAKTAAKSIGQSQQNVFDAAGVFGTFGKAAGLSGKELARFSIDFTKLASDIASFNNATPEEVITALGAGLRGESEPLRRFGVLLSAEAIEMEAVNLGLVKFRKNTVAVRRATLNVEKAQKRYTVALKRFGPDSMQARSALVQYESAQQTLSKTLAGKMEKLTQEQKILAATSLIYKQTSDAQGDLERTSESVANQQKFVKAAFEDLQGQLGKAFLPLIQEILPYLSKFAEWMGQEKNVKIFTTAILGLAAAYTALSIAQAAQALTNPVGAIVAGVVAVTAALAILYSKYQGFRDFMNPVMNAFVGYWENLYNVYRQAINLAIRMFNLLPFADIPLIPEIKLPRVGLESPPGSGTNVPKMADGGIVTGPTLALIGEGNESEAVIPLSKLDRMMNGGGGGVVINVNGGDPNAVVDALRRYYRQSGPIPVAVQY